MHNKKRLVLLLHPLSLSLVLFLLCVRLVLLLAVVSFSVLAVMNASYRVLHVVLLLASNIFLVLLGPSPQSSPSSGARKR